MITTFLKLSVMLVVSFSALLTLIIVLIGYFLVYPLIEPIATDLWNKLEEFIKM